MLSSECEKKDLGKNTHTQGREPENRSTVELGGILAIVYLIPPLTKEETRDSETANVRHLGRGGVRTKTQFPLSCSIFVSNHMLSLGKHTRQNILESFPRGK